MASEKFGTWTVGKGYLEFGLAMNDGSIAVMEDEGYDVCNRVCLVDLTVKPKRGAAHKAKDDLRDARAQLISAAHDLLAACEALMACKIENPLKMEPADRAQLFAAQDRARAAIAKAKGE